MSKKLKTAFTAVTILFCLSFGMGPGYAKGSWLAKDAEQMKDVHIKISHIDMNNRGEVSALYLRIVNVATEMCHRSYFNGNAARPETYMERKCISRTVKSSVHGAKIPALKAVFKQTPKKIRFSSKALENYRVATAN